MSSTPTNQPLSVAPPPSRVRKVFFGANGIRSGWRFLIFVLLLLTCLTAVRLGLMHIPPIAPLFAEAMKGTLTPGFEFIFESTAIAALFGVTFLMARIEKRPFRQYGLPLKGAFGKLFWQGVVWGLAFMSIEIFAIYALHGFSFGSLAIVGFELVRYAMAWAVGFVLVGIFEEFTFRGYAQFVLSEGIGFWPAAFLLSASFGAVHLQNPGEGWVGALSVTVFGLFACFTLRRTGSLWFAVGFHAAGDFAETFLYSVPDSGMLAKGHLLNSNLHGPRWLTGGTIGPEGSVFGFLLFLVAFVIFAWLYPPVKPENPLIEPTPQPAASSAPTL